MYVDGGGFSRRNVPAGPRKPTAREERVILGLLAVIAVLLLIAPIGGATVIHAIIALF